VKGGGMVNNAMEQQRPILHQSQHGIPSWRGFSRLLGQAPLAGRL
jgi:hypothetical protein